jgi:hypothetical protein
MGVANCYEGQIISETYMCQMQSRAPSGGRADFVQKPTP